MTQQQEEKDHQQRQWWYHAHLHSRSRGTETGPLCTVSVVMPLSVMLTLPCSASWLLPAFRSFRNSLPETNSKAASIHKAGSATRNQRLWLDGWTSQWCQCCFRCCHGHVGPSIHVLLGQQQLLQHAPKVAMGASNSDRSVRSTWPPLLRMAPGMTPVPMMLSGLLG